MTDEPIDIYAERMRSSRTFGGNIEIVAMSQLYESVFIVTSLMGIMKNLKLLFAPIYKFGLSLLLSLPTIPKTCSLSSI